MRALVRAHPFLFYYVLSLVIAGLVTVVGVTWGANSPSADPLSYWHYAQAHHMVLNAISIAAFGLTTGGPFVFLVFLFGGAPSISALITSAIGWGKAGLVRLLSRFKPWRRGVTAREGLRVYAILIGIYLLMFAFFMWFTSAYGKPADKDYVWTVLGGSAVTAFFI
ncbi:MAG: hypothetical protein JO359_06295, partial [Candidatus Eremiobacteraeota bacterium]|nr:hypothetical protein [Candidatus Eremiobacteraeota bacterium]